MATGNSCQSQASYLNTIEEKPNIEVSPKNLTDQQTATAAIKKICQQMNSHDQIQFQHDLQQLQEYFKKGYSYLFMTQVQLMRKMMNRFTHLGKELQRNQDDGTLQSRMLFILSMIAELLKENSKFYYPFTRKFLITVFTIDCDLLKQSPIKNDILAILAVIYENLSRQIKLLCKYNMQNQLKKSILENYGLVQEIFTIKMFNKVISNLSNKGIEFTTADFHKYRVLETITNYISRNKLELFMIKMQMTVLNLSGKIPAVGMLPK